MSVTAVMWPIISALCKASLFLSCDAGLWQPINEAQKEFLTNYHVKRDELNKFNEKELRTWASSSHEELNDILKSEGFDIRLNDLNGGLGVVSILDIFVHWLEEGEKTKILENKKIRICSRPLMSWPAVRLKKGVSSFETSDYKGVKIETKSGDLVWMAVPLNSALKEQEGLSLLHQIMVLRATIKDSALKTEREVIFPMIDLNQEVDISWMLHMCLPSGHYIDQAKQQTKLKMDHTGAHASSAVALGILKCCMPIEPIVINEPFYLWIERPGMTCPIFAGIMTQEHWKDPKGLDFKKI